MYYKTIHRTLSIFLVLVFLFNITGIAATKDLKSINISNQESGYLTTYQSLPENIQALLPDDKRDDVIYLSLPGQEIDDVELCTIRTEDPTTGEGTIIMHSVPVKFLNNDGEVEFINTSIMPISDDRKRESGFAYQNAANSFTVEFGVTAGDGIRFDEAFVISTNQNPDSKITNISSKTGSGKVRYESVFGPNTGVEYINIENGVKENIILEKYTGQTRFDFIFCSDTHIPILAEDGLYVLVANKKTPSVPEYRFQSLYAYDSFDPTRNQQPTSSSFRHMNERLTYDLKENKDGTFTITVVVPEDYLSHPEVVYPVTIDPSISQLNSNGNNSQDTFVNEGAPNAQVYSALDYIRFGKVNGYKNFGYHRFTALPSLPTGTFITSAYLRFTFRTGQTSPTQEDDVFIWTPKVIDHQWEETTITWANQPYGYSGHAVDIAYNGIYLDFFDAALTDSVIDWYNYPAYNYGIDFTYSNEDYNDYNSVVSSEGDAARAPKLFINYSTIELTNNREYYLRNVNSNKYLTVSGSSSADGTDLIQTYFKGNLRQRFKLVYNSATLDYSLYPACASNSCVEITNASSDNYAVVQIWSKPSSGVMDSQRFRLQKNSDNSYSLLTSVTYHSKAVAVCDSSLNENAVIVQLPAIAISGKWYIEPANKTVKTNSDITVNSNYNRDNAATYATSYADEPNTAYEYIEDADCTNFVSQSLYAGGSPMLPTHATWGVTERSSIQNWFYLSGALSSYADDWVSVPFTSATAFNQHWGQSNLRAYQTIEYTSGAEALKDIDFLTWYLKKGDVIQLSDSGSGYEHSMIIHSNSVPCTGLHRGVFTCDNEGKDEILYAGHSIDYMDGHLRYLLTGVNNRVVFIKIKKDT